MPVGPPRSGSGRSGSQFWVWAFWGLSAAAENPNQVPAASRLSEKEKHATADPSRLLRPAWPAQMSDFIFFVIFNVFLNF